jgi:hypothetical protein
MLKKSDFKEFHNLADNLDKDLEDLSNTTSEILTKLNYNANSLAFEEKLLFTADYYYSLNALEYLKQEREKLNKELSNYK